MTNSFIESRLLFEFADHVDVISFDDTTFYNKHYKQLRHSKGVDFIAYDRNKKVLYFIEVKNFYGFERAFKKRMRIDNENSLSIEIPLKVRDTVAGLAGASKIKEGKEISNFFPLFADKDVQIRVILFLEGRFSHEAKLFKAIMDRMKKNMKWLTTKVMVENVETSRSSLYKVKRLYKTNLID
ncbi:DUF6661 family protein [Bacillus sp. FJAT-45350]|uniref:DUF6661 family protein n=1 Tax=Bacillus sp. FJAT-45350 TaxID=2011014 RepID=UPI000BB75137|nr:DUF6661 family protein [Bacillus sp. FJAT-45350]